VKGSAKWGGMAESETRWVEVGLTGEDEGWKARQARFRENFSKGEKEIP